MLSNMQERGEEEKTVVDELKQPLDLEKLGIFVSGAFFVFAVVVA